MEIESILKQQREVNVTLNADDLVIICNALYLQFDLSCQPTVYDVDAVVEQISRSAFERYGNPGMGGEKVVNLDDAIEIVKNGGRE